AAAPASIPIRVGSNAVLGIALAGGAVDAGAGATGNAAVATGRCGDTACFEIELRMHPAPVRLHMFLAARRTVKQRYSDRPGFALDWPGERPPPGRTRE